MTNTVPSADELRAQMVARSTAYGWPQSRRVGEVMTTVPRHLFVPDASLEDAYAEQIVTIAQAADGRPLSCASVPTIVAMMLDQLDVHPGDRILEIGAGTGYNAALLAELTGPTGQVTTVDIDADVTAHARHALDATGYHHVHVATRDGALGDADHAPYDRIIVTVGAWDLPPAWWAQLVPGGRLVVPLRWRGQTRSIAFTLTDDRDQLTAESVELCGFVPMVGQLGEHDSAIDDGVTLYWDNDQTIDPTDLTGVLHQPRTTRWSGVTVGNEERLDGIWLQLTGTEPGTCRLAATPQAVDAGIADPVLPSRSPALADGSALAYLTIRPHVSGPPRLFELGAIGHGPHGSDLADRFCQHLRTWSDDRNPLPTVTAHPARTAPPAPKTGLRITKAQTKLDIVPDRPSDSPRSVTEHRQRITGASDTP